MRSLPKNTLCPCQSGQAYNRCCAPFHHRKAHAPTPARLFYARFCAYALGIPLFLIQTTEKDSPAWQPDRAAWERNILRAHRSIRFLSCSVLTRSEPEPEEDSFFMEYCYTTQNKNPPYQTEEITERGLFHRIDGCWYYSDSMPAPIRFL